MHIIIYKHPNKPKIRMEQLALVTNDGHLLLYTFEFPKLTPLLRAQASDIPLYCPVYN